jgi:hypothetical protein
LFAAMARQQARNWFDSGDATEQVTRLFAAAQLAQERAGHSYAKDVLMDRLDAVIRTKALPVAIRRQAEMYLRRLRPRIPAPRVSGRKPSSVEGFERQTLALDTRERLKNLLPRSLSDRDDETRRALVEEFKGDGDDGVPQVRRLQQWSRALVTRSIVTARIRRRERERGDQDV